MPTGPVLVFAALPQECRTVLKTLRDVRGTSPRWEGRAGTTDVIVRQTGVGLEAAREVAAAELGGGPPASVVCTGVAGGLSPSVGRGDAIVPDRVAFEDGEGIPVDPALRTLAAPLLPERRSRRGLLVSVQRAARTPAEKAQLAAKLRADAVDMESAALVDVARAHGVPAVVIRAASDTAEERVPDLDGLDLSQPRDQVRLALRALRSAREIHSLLQLARGARAASQTLTEVLGSFLPRLHF